MSMKPVWAKPEPGFDPNDNTAILNYNSSAQAHPLTARGLRAPPLEQRLQDEIENYRKLHNEDPSEEEKAQMKKVLYNNSGWLQGLKVDVAGQTTVPIREFNRLYEENESTIEWVSRYRAATEAKFRAQQEDLNNKIAGLERDLGTKKSLEEQIRHWKAMLEKVNLHGPDGDIDSAFCNEQIKSFTEKLDAIEAREKYHKDERQRFDNERERFDSVTVGLRRLLEKMKSDLQKADQKLKIVEMENKELRKNFYEARDRYDELLAKYNVQGDELGDLKCNFENRDKLYQEVLDENTKFRDEIRKLQEEIAKLRKIKDCDELRKEHEELLKEIERLRNKATTGGNEPGLGSGNTAGGRGQQSGSGQQQGQSTAAGGYEANKTILGLRAEVEDLKTRLANANQVKNIYDELWAKGSSAVPNDHPAGRNPLPADFTATQKIEHLQNRLCVLVADHVNQGKNQRWYEEKVKLLEENLQKAKRGESFDTEVIVTSSLGGDDASGESRISHYKIERIIKQYETGERSWIPGQQMTPELAKQVREICLGQLKPKSVLFDGLYTRDDVAFWVNRIQSLEKDLNDKNRDHYDQGLVLHTMQQDNAGLNEEIDGLKLSLALAAPSGSGTSAPTSLVGQAPSTIAGTPSTGITSDNPDDAIPGAKAGGEPVIVEIKGRVSRIFRSVFGRSKTTKKPQDQSHNLVLSSIPPINHHF